MNNICCIISAGPSEPYIKDGALIIAADGGKDKLEKAGITPDLIIGDFDSADKPEGENVIVFPVEKDDTDTMLAVKEAIKRGFSTIYISCGLGGLLDHTVANIQALIYAKNNGADAFLIGNNECAAVIKGGENIVFKPENKGRCSAFAVCGQARGVNIKGLKYGAESISLSPDFPLGVSNSFVNNKAEISVNTGYLLIIWQGTPDSIIDGA